jgi:hypothetical protein
MKKCPRYRKDQIVYEEKVDDGKLQIIKTDDKQFLWHIVGHNNEIICGCEPMQRLQGCVRNLNIAEGVLYLCSTAEEIADDLDIKL